MKHLDAITYYDAYSQRYDQIRQNAYHQLISEITRDFLFKFISPKNRVLDLGCGTGINLEWLKKTGAKVIGFDLSQEMLKQACGKGNTVVRGTAPRLPFEPQSFDVVYSFKVLPHVEEIDTAFEEIARVLKPGGVAVLESYNPHSFRGVIKQWLKPPLKVAPNLTEKRVFTRFDSPGTMNHRLGKNFRVIASRGVITLIPFSKMYEIPGFRPALRWLEWRLCDSVFKNWGGFFITAAQRI